ncbi:MFS transporter [Anaerostipes sp.]|uniref:MFS transporter n=1 Tax=Anaerostipes sp. TaxID=1872530 RepID=UPI0025C3436B|nr:MFS transporter [Anaerostipes sp.]
MNKKNFRMIAAGQLISLLGSAVQRFSMSLYVLDLTGSPGLFSAILAVSMLPYVLLAPAAGKITDSFSKKKVMIFTDLFSAAVISCYAVVLFSGNDRPAVIAVTMILLSAASTVYAPAVTASIPLVVPDGQLYRANGIIQQIGSAANFAGPVVAGMLYGFFGIRWIVLLNGISFFASALMETCLSMQEEIKRSENKPALLGSVKEMHQGFLYLKKSRPVVLKMIVSYGLSNLFIVPVFSVAAPHFIKNVLGLSSEIYGTVEGITVLGMISGGMLISICPKYFSMENIHRVLYLMPAAFFLMCFAGILSQSPFVNLSAFAAGGFTVMLSLGLSNVISLTYMQQAVPGDMLGKTSAFSTAAATATIPPGQILFGQILEVGLTVPMVFLFVSAASFGTAAFVKHAVKKIKVSKAH